MDAMDTTSPSSTPHGQNPDHAETSAPLEVESIIPAPLFKVGDKVRIRDPGFVFLLSGSGPKSKRSLDSIHASQCIDMPDFIQDPNSNLITAVTNLHTHSVPGSFSAQSPKLENPCLCLSWSARNTGTEACNAAIAYLKGKYPDTEQDNETWFNAQKLVLDRVSTAQWAAYDAIRAKIGPVVDSLDHSDPQLTFDEYAEGHVQPWMEAKLIRAIRDATLETFAEIEKNTLIKTEPSFCGSFSFYSLSTPYNRVDRSAFTCLCKEYEVFVIAEKAIDATCYRMEVRATCVLGEDDDLKESKERASQYILNAAQDAIECITKDGDEDRGCKVVDEIHMKAWMRWHVEWKCDQAKREFEALMEKDPRREDDENRQQRGDELDKAMEMERIKDIGGEEEAWNIIEGEHADDDARDCQFISLAHWGRMPYPGCECLLWGMCEMANKAINETIESFKGVCPVANSWAYCLMARIQERTLGGLQEIRDIVSAKPSKPDSRIMGQGPKDHFPDWQQDIIKKRIVDTVSEIKETIQEHGGAPGPIATAAHKIAEESLKRYRDKFYDRFDETLGSEDGASLELVASATEKMVEGVEISQCCSLLE